MKAATSQKWDSCVSHGLDMAEIIPDGAASRSAPRASTRFQGAETEKKCSSPRLPGGRCHAHIHSLSVSKFPSVLIPAVLSPQSAGSTGRPPPGEQTNRGQMCPEKLRLLSRSLLEQEDPRVCVRATAATALRFGQWLRAAAVCCAAAESRRSYLTHGASPLR